MRFWFATGSILAALGIAAGAFGAHALQERLTERQLATWTTAAHYHLIHAVGLLVVSLVASGWSSRWVTVGGSLLLAGVVLFSGSLYALSLTNIRALGAITPLGGVCFITGWLALALAALRNT